MEFSKERTIELIKELSLQENEFLAHESYGSVHTQVRRYNTHRIKILPEYLDAVLDGSKKAELRFNDRGYQVGDYCYLMENGIKGRSLKIKITHIVELQYFIPEANEWVMFSFERCL